METLFSEKVVTYTGTELRPGWLAQTFGVGPEALVAWLGPCHVATADLVDLEDQRAGAEIHAAMMLHFIAEHPGRDLLLTVLRQRLLVAGALQVLHRDPQAVPGGAWGQCLSQIQRQGDDLYLSERKLSVSIATLSPTSGLIHFALNVDPSGAPVPAIGLAELGVDPRLFAHRLLKQYGEEMESAVAACRKVREVV